MIEIVEMSASHVPQVAELEKMCFHDPWSEASIASELRNPLACWLVMNIAVHPDFRRRSIAQMLVEQLVAKLKARQSLRLMLEVRSSNMGAQSLYEKMGFTQVGLRKNYYRNPKEDALILRKEWEI